MKTFLFLLAITFSPRFCVPISVDMSDNDFHVDGNSQSSTTYSQEAGTFRRNGHIVIKDRPCKVDDITISETGEYHFVATDIFTSEKLEDTFPSSSYMCEVPIVTRSEYDLVDIEDEYVTVMDSAGNVKDDLKLPADNEPLRTELKTAFEEGRKIVVYVLSAMGEEKIVSMRDRE